MKCDKKVAVYMPCYNHEKYVGAAIESILNQTYQNWEFFIVNDGSTDRTGEVIQSYRDKRIHFFDFAENTRMVGAVNYLLSVIEQGDYDYIQGMASDDMLEPTKIERQLQILEEHPEYKACFTWDRFLVEEGAAEVSLKQNYSHVDNRSRFSWMEKFYAESNCINSNSCLMDKKVFFELGGLNVNYLQLGDYRLWFRLAAKYPFYMVREELTIYRRHTANLSAPGFVASMRHANENYRIMEEIFESLSSQEFYRAYYKYLPYKLGESSEELLAAKFFFYKNSGNSGMCQSAMKVYFEHCTNQKFIGILESEYNFFHRDFIEFTGKTGLVYQVLSKDNIAEITEGYTAYVPLASLLFAAIDAGKLNENFIQKFTYSVLGSVYDLMTDMEDGFSQFQHMKQSFEKIREKKRTCRYQTLIVVSGNSTWDVKSFIEKHQEKNTEYVIAYADKKEECALAVHTDAGNKEIPEGVRVVDLFDGTNLCLRFVDELLENLQKIYYVDCLSSEYECLDMVYGYSLGISQSCIMSEEKCSELNQQEMRAVLMMQEVITY